MKFSKRKDEIILGLLIMAFILLLFFIYADTSSIRYTASNKEMSKIIQAGKERDIKSLNIFLEKTKAIDSKLVIMSYLSDANNISSIPILVKHLNYNLPWWDKLDTELKIRPISIRIAAYQVLLSYDEDSIKKLRVYFNTRNRLRKLYITAILYKKGYYKYEGLKKIFRNLEDNYGDDVSFLLKDLDLKDEYYKEYK